MSELVIIIREPLSVWIYVCVPVRVLARLSLSRHFRE